MGIMECLHIAKLSRKWKTPLANAPRSGIIYFLQQEMPKLDVSRDPKFGDSTSKESSE